MDIVSDYILARGARFFPGWTREAIEDYSAFHLNQGTMTVAIMDKKVAGLIVGWQQATNRLEPWRWQATDPEGGFWWWDHFFADNVEVALALGDTMTDIWPQSFLLPAAAMRNGKLRQYKPGAALKIFTKAIERYGKHES